MTRRLTPSLTAAVLASLLFTGCYAVWFGHPPPRRAVVWHYWYYPGAQVYFDYEREVYFYFYLGTWHTVKTLPTWIKVDRKNYVPLELKTERPYQHHETHRVEYPPGYVGKPAKPAKPGKPVKVEKQPQKIEKGPAPKAKGKRGRGR